MELETARTATRTKRSFGLESAFVGNGHLSPHVPRDAVKLLDHGGRLGNGWAKPKKLT